MDSNRIGLAIKTLRNKAGLTQKQLAQELNITDKAVSKWERGIGVPDVSIINKLSDILNIDADNLLAGNIAYLESEWVGVIRLDLFKMCISIFSEIYGKPLVYIYFCYFALAGIRNIYIICHVSEVDRLTKLIEFGNKCGLHIVVNGHGVPKNKNKMVVKGPVFLYGQDITKFFQRAMSHNNANVELLVPCNNRKNVVKIKMAKNLSSDNSEYSQNYIKLPFCFERLKANTTEYEYLGRGVISFCIENNDDIIEAGTLLRIIKKYSNMEAYNLAEIVRRRGIISEQQYLEISEGDEYLMSLYEKK